ncbi:thermonuclease family protein [Frigoribacterium sp. CFBP 13605]|uniref:thermonuclease family protein n=1 Tax=Frigoribacterium sp. CFBP 13605 TaxID=2774034 RepID=UPI001906E464|nr:thermonuclease family protein [Frigoribacterium sp. CFBP 13605]MBD8141847.1 thermonuclease family protein [Frigoribacterium sp. CFBP 13605]
MSARRHPSRRRLTPRRLLGVLVVLVAGAVLVAFPRLLGDGSAGGGPGGAGAVPVPTSVPAAAVEAVVDRVVDGDTVVVLVAGERERIRLIGVDTPETVKPDAPVDCFGPEASTFTTAALPEGATVWLEDDASQGDADRYDRLLRYVWSPDGTMLNERLVAEGYGREDTYDDAYRYRDRFVAAEASAEASRVGLWGACG